MKGDNLFIHSSFEVFLVDVCDTIYAQYEKALEQRQKFTFVLSGGNTPQAILAYLEKHYSYKINWDLVYFFWLDERCTPPASLESNYYMAHEFLLSKLEGVGGVFRMKGELDRKLATTTYARELVAFFGSDEICFDLILLGMGTDGHIASVFPGLERSERARNLVFYTDKKFGGFYRISLGLDVINASRFNLLVLKGDKKLNVFKSIDKTELLPKDAVSYSKIITLLE